jgi:hypothetical protein
MHAVVAVGVDISCASCFPPAIGGLSTPLSSPALSGQELEKKKSKSEPVIECYKSDFHPKPLTSSTTPRTDCSATRSLSNHPTPSGPTPSSVLPQAAPSARAPRCTRRQRAQSVDSDCSSHPSRLQAPWSPSSPWYIPTCRCCRHCCSPCYSVCG